jgi:hypothetical protein
MLRGELNGGRHECAPRRHWNFRQQIENRIGDGGTRRSKAFKNIPGQSAALVWSTPAVPTLPIDGTDVISEKSTYVPPTARRNAADGRDICSRFRLCGSKMRTAWP